MNTGLKKFLIIKPSSMGDIIQSNPVVSALKSSFAGCTVKWLVFEQFKDVLDLFPGIDGRIVWKKDSWIKGYIDVIKEVRREKFDAVIDIQGLARSAFIAFMSGARVKIGVPGMKEFSWILVKEPYRANKKLNAVYRSLESVRYLTSLKYEPQFDLKVPEEAERAASELLKAHGVQFGEQLAGVVPMVRGLSKQWPLEYYVELVQELRKQHRKLKILVFGAMSVFKFPQDSGIIDLTGKTTIPVMAALMKKCEFVTGGDTGPVHLAAALDVRVAAIFGGSDINETAPINKKTVLLSKNYACAPCRGRPGCSDYPCLKDIKASDVFEVVRKWIN